MDGSDSTRPRVDVVIAVHTPARPVERAVRSVLETTRARVRVNVVVHNTDPVGIRARLAELADDPRVRLLELHDGIPSPAGPMNVGLAHATADFTCLLGSDDELGPGAFDEWLAVAEEDRADVVIAPLVRVGGSVDPYPPVRNGRRDALHPVRDRLAYRSAPLGLVSRARFGELRLAERLGSGEDIPFVVAMWFSGARISFPVASPPYLEHIDGDDRVTYEARPLHEAFRFLEAVAALPGFPVLGRDEREALVVKILRIHVFDALQARCRPYGLTGDDRDDLTAVLTRLREWSPTAERLLSRADTRALRTAQDPEASGDAVRAALAARRRYRTPGAVITADPLRALHRQAPLRTLAAGVLVGRRLTRNIERRGLAPPSGLVPLG